MSIERGHALRWVCPECQTSIRAEATSPSTVQVVLEDEVRDHLATFHADAPVNAHAQAAGWLAAAGHQVELWGGPFDGARPWLPPGELPQALGVLRDERGGLGLLRASTARLLAPEAAVYRQGEVAAAQARGGRVRYLYERRAPSV